MAANEVGITVSGWVGSDPRYYPGQEGSTPYTSFRLGTTRRVFDREQGRYVDSRTDWYTVKAFRSTATNVSESIRRSDPVVVQGRLEIEDWETAEGRIRTTPTLVAAALGHDLTKGTSRFVRTIRPEDAAGERSPGAGREAREHGPGEHGEAGERVAGPEADRDGPGAGGPGSDPEGDGPDRMVPIDVTGAAVLDDDAAVRLAR
jgi:single-strand DNA-binding protein